MHRYALLCLAAMSLSRGLVAAPSAETTIHSVTDISHEFTFYFDGRFAGNYIEPVGGKDARNWATLRKCDLRNVNLLILQSGASPCPYIPGDIAAVKEFMEKGGGVVALGDFARFEGEKKYRLNDLVSAFGISFVDQAAKEPLDVISAMGVRDVQTYGGKTLRASDPREWNYLIRDAEDRWVMATRAVGKGRLLVASRALAGRQPDAKDPINADLWQSLMVVMAKNKAVSPDRPPQTLMPEVKIDREGLAIRSSEYLKPYADAIFREYSRARPALEGILGVPPSKGMLASLILLPTGGGGFSDGENIGLGVWWGGFPKQTYGMVELLGHETMHSWVLPFPEPLWNEGLATYVGILLGRELGMTKEADAALQGWLDSARKEDPDMKKYSLLEDSPAPHAVRMAKPMWIFEQLRKEKPDILARYFRLKRQIIDPARYTRYTADDSVAVLSLAMERDLFPWFQSLGIPVDRSRTEVKRP
ncbi:MAG: hypothetical protein IT210_04425 [Armatimonadetes bacterium]|nr:hypothetical protein [Armatimonadota bacterium]